MTSSTWTTNELRRRLPISSKRRVAGLPIETWALLACAFVLGLAVAAAAFVGIWRSAARQGDHANAARAVTARRLAATTGELKLLASSLQSSKTKLARARRELRIGKATLARSRAELGSRAAAAAVVRRQAPLLTQQTSLLISDLAALRAYLAKTPGAAVDHGFVQSQLVYIAGVAARLQRTTTALQRAATSP
jgi:septal ring factor EnvC (AmiA/AmiB activator)